MGYRHYFYKANKNIVDSMRNLSYQELIDYLKETKSEALEIDDYDDGISETYINFHELFCQKKIFEFGKLYYEDTPQKISSKGEFLFTNNDTRKYFKDYNPYIISEDGFLEAIEIYKNKIISYWEDLKNDGAIQVLPFGIELERSDITKEKKVERLIEDELFYWKNNYAINLDRDKERITNSWMYEHEIFDLVRIYKTFDFDNNYLLFYGY